MKQQVCEAIKAQDHDDLVRVHDAYSGRGMFGNTTHALVGDSSDISLLVADAIDMEEDADIKKELRHFLKNHRSDTMGKYSVVWY